MQDEFLYKEVPALGRRVFRLGLATNYGVEAGDVEWALDQHDGNRTHAADALQIGRNTLLRKLK